LAIHPAGKDGRAIESLIPFIASQQPIHGRTTAYVCENYVCNLPVTDPAKLQALIDGETR
jgi:uncharacterized protein YyaL (SSP411 family)